MPLEPARALLTDRVALVTGGANGIGRATAVALARFGAHLAVCDRDAENLATVAKEIEAIGRDALATELDVRDAPRVAEFVAAVADRFGHVDVLVNNAGGTFRANFLDVNAKGQDSLVAENFSSVTHLVRAVVPLMHEGGSIVNVTSSEAHRAAPGFAVYAAMKAAVSSLTKSLAVELGDRRIRVNCVAPDLIPTPGVGPLEGGGAGVGPLPIDGHPDDVAGAIVFLAGDLARFITGTTVHVDSGTIAAGGWRRGPDGGFRP